MVKGGQRRAKEGTEKGGQMEAAKGIKKIRLKGVIECKERLLERVKKGMRNIAKRDLRKRAIGGL
jgi:hypothetical protein